MTHNTVIFKTQNNPRSIIQSIESFFKKTKEQEALVDISDMNPLDAARTAVLCSTRAFVQFPGRKIRWKLRDSQTKGIISSLILDNMELEIKYSSTTNKAYATK